ncbi:hypothetical protein V8E55_001994 [Tylopilus felleus]
MPDDSPKEHPTGEPAGQVQPEPPAETSQPVQEVSDRAELLARARTFISSPQVRLQDSDAKWTFLAEKGLTPSEIDQLLRESPPSVPPRTYPAQPPSNLPNLFIGAARIFTWLTGASAIVLLIYYRYLLPRLTQSYQARLALRKHQSALIARLTESASALKATQAESYKDLPRAVTVYEDSQYAECRTIDDLLSRVASFREETSEPDADIPDVTILRCALEELGHTKTDGTSTEELFRHLESKLVWLGGEEGATRQSDLWNQLNNCPLFVSSESKSITPSPLPLDHPSRLLWKYVPPPPPTTSPLLASLENLQAALPRSQDAAPASSDGPLPIPIMSARQRTLQVLSDFTGYITTQTYSLGYPLIRGSDGDLVEDELRREIRALKGLVLNRRSFLPASVGASGITNEPRGPS